VACQGPQLGMFILGALPLSVGLAVGSSPFYVHPEGSRPLNEGPGPNSSLQNVTVNLKHSAWLDQTQTPQ